MKSSLARWMPWAWVGLAAAWIAWQWSGLLADTWRLDTDDAFITLRYSKNLAAGHGLTWNPGEAPIEGFSNFSFVLLGALAILGKGSPILSLKIAGVVGLASSAVFVYLLGRRWLTPPEAMLGPLLLMLHPGQTLWAVSGLETTCYQGIVLASLWCFFRGHAAMSLQDGQHSGTAVGSMLVAGLCLFVASTTRPEAPIIAVWLGGLLVASSGHKRWSRRKAHEKAPNQNEVRTIVAFALSFGLPYALYFGWRVWHFGQLLPNSVLCKARYAGDPWVLMEQFWPMFWPMILLALIVKRGQRDVQWLGLLGISAVYVAILYGTDPIVGYYDRHFMTSYACLAPLAAMGLANASVWPLKRVPRTLTSMAVFVLVAVFAGDLDARVRQPLVGWSKNYETRMNSRRELGLWLNDTLDSSQSVLIGDTGMVGFVSHSRIIDAFCLNSAQWTSAEIAGSTPRFLDWLFEQKPDAIVVHSIRAERLVPRREYGFFPALVKHIAFQAEYTKAKTIGAEADEFHYWVFLRDREEHRSTQGGQ